MYLQKNLINPPKSKTFQSKTFDQSKKKIFRPMYLGSTDGSLRYIQGNSRNIAENGGYIYLYFFPR